MRNNKGITLIGIIITVAVMLILIAVVISISTGDSSIISKAEKAKYENSISQIEQKLNEIYSENYDDVESFNLGDIHEGTKATKSRALAYYLEDKIGKDDNIFRGACPNWGGGYVPDDKFAYMESETNRLYYFLSPEKLKKFDSSLDVLSLEEPDNREKPEDFDYMYLVSEDLQVFIILGESEEDIIGITEEDIGTYDVNTVIYDKESSWAKIFESSEDITYQNGQAKSSITINYTQLGIEDDFNLSGIGFLAHLSSLKIVNAGTSTKPISSLKGLRENGRNITYLWLENSYFSDYSALQYLSNLDTLFIYNMDQAELDKIMVAMSETNYTKLVNINIMGAGSLADYVLENNFQTDGAERYFGYNGSTLDSGINNINCLKNLTRTNEKCGEKFKNNK